MAAVPLRNLFGVPDVRLFLALIPVNFDRRQITALARVTASSYGYDREDKHGFHAAGYEEACNLLGVEA